MPFLSEWILFWAHHKCSKSCQSKPQQSTNISVKTCEGNGNVDLYSA